MDKKESSALQDGFFPKLDRSKISVGSLHEESDEKAYWLSKTPLERLEALELYREIAFGYDPLTTRLQRILEIAGFKPH